VSPHQLSPTTALQSCLPTRRSSDLISSWAVVVVVDLDGDGDGDVAGDGGRLWSHKPRLDADGHVAVAVAVQRSRLRQRLREPSRSEERRVGQGCHTSWWAGTHSRGG